MELMIKAKQMIEKKFRAYYNGKMLYNVPVSADGKYHHCISTGFALQYEPEYVALDVMQYAGINDVKGNELYENDICKFMISANEELVNPPETLRVVIEFEYCCFGFRHLFPEYVHEDDVEWTPFYNDGDFWDTNYFHLIGNTIENPELMDEDDSEVEDEDEDLE